MTCPGLAAGLEQRQGPVGQGQADELRRDDAGAGRALHRGVARQHLLGLPERCEGLAVVRIGSSQAQRSCLLALVPALQPRRPRQPLRRARARVRRQLQPAAVLHVLPRSVADARLPARRRRLRFLCVRLLRDRRPPRSWRVRLFLRVLLLAAIIYIMKIKFNAVLLFEVF